MFDFNNAAADLTDLAASLLGEPVIVSSADGLISVATSAVIEYNVTVETDTFAGQVLQGQTVAAFAKPRLAGVRIEEGATVQAAAKNYQVRSVQDEDEWVVVAVLVPVKD